MVCGHVSAETYRHVGPELRMGEGGQPVDQLLDIGVAAGLQQDDHLGGAVIVVDIGVEVAGLAGDRIEEQVLRDQFLVVGQHVEGRIVAVHRQVHALQEIDDRQRLADEGLLLGEALGFLDRSQHLRAS